MGITVADGRPGIDSQGPRCGTAEVVGRPPDLLQGYRRQGLYVFLLIACKQGTLRATLYVLCRSLSLAVDLWYNIVLNSIKRTIILIVVGVGLP